MTGLREAVGAGSIDQRFVDSARNAARAVTSTRPSPMGGRYWLTEDIDDLIHETVARVTPDKLVLAANEAHSDAEYTGWLRRALRTTLDIWARGTPSGRIIRALDDALREDPGRFCLEDGFWCLRDDDRQPSWQEGLSALIAEAWEVDTSTVRMSQSASKTPPMASRRDIRAVCAEVLDLSGPLRKVDLAEVLAHRFNVPFEGRFGYLDLDDEDQEDPIEPTSEEEFDGIQDDLAARWMFEQLTDEERRVLGHLLGGASTRDLAAALDCSKYRAEIVRNRLTEKLRRLADNSSEGSQGAVERLLDLIRQHDDLRHLAEQDEVKYGC